MNTIEQIKAHNLCHNHARDLADKHAHMGHTQQALSYDQARGLIERRDYVKAYAYLASWDDAFFPFFKRTLMHGLFDLSEVQNNATLWTMKG